jgi:hypothetical protein
MNMHIPEYVQEPYVDNFYNMAERTAARTDFEKAVGVWTADQHPTPRFAIQLRRRDGILSAVLSCSRGVWTFPFAVTFLT